VAAGAGDISLKDGPLQLVIATVVSDNQDGTYHLRCIDVNTNGDAIGVIGDEKKAVAAADIIGEVEGEREAASGRTFTQLREKLAASSPTLLRADFSRMQIKDSTVTDPALGLAAALKTNHHVTNIDLHANMIGDEGMIALADALSDDIQRGTAVELDANAAGSSSGLWKKNKAKGRGDTQESIFTTRIRQAAPIQILSLSKNEIGDEGAKAIAKYLLTSYFGEYPPLKHLSLFKNRITSVGVKALASAIGRNDTLEKLFLRSNREVQDAGVVALAEALTAKHAPALTTDPPGDAPKYAKYKRMIEGEVAEQDVRQQMRMDNMLKTEVNAFFAGLGRHPLAVLKIEDVGMGVPGAAAVGQMLASDYCMLDVLELKENTAVGWEGMQGLAFGLKLNQTLRTLNISKINLGDRGAVILAGVLRENSTLTKVYATGNRITDHGAGALIAVLELAATGEGELQEAKLQRAGGHTLEQGARVRVTEAATRVRGMREEECLQDGADGADGAEGAEGADGAEAEVLDADDNNKVHVRQTNETKALDAAELEVLTKSSVEKAVLGLALTKLVLAQNDISPVHMTHIAELLAKVRAQRAQRAQQELAEREEEKETAKEMVGQVLEGGQVGFRKEGAAVLKPRVLLSDGTLGWQEAEDGKAVSADGQTVVCGEGECTVRIGSTPLSTVAATTIALKYASEDEKFASKRGKMYFGICRGSTDPTKRPNLQEGCSGVTSSGSIYRNGQVMKTTTAHFEVDAVAKEVVLRYVPSRRLDERQTNRLEWSIEGKQNDQYRDVTGTDTAGHDIYFCVGVDAPSSAVFQIVRSTNLEGGEGGEGEEGGEGGEAGRGSGEGGEEVDTASAAESARGWVDTLAATMSRAYDEALRSEGGEPLSRSKLCLVGEGRVGKTCALRAMLNQNFQPMASTVGAQTGLVETKIVNRQRGGDGKDNGMCALERLDVKDWKVYAALGLEFDNAMARYVASIVQRILSFAKARGKALAELRAEEVTELQQLVVSEAQAEAEGGGGSAGQQIRGLISRLCAGDQNGGMEMKQEEGDEEEEDDEEAMLLAAVAAVVTTSHGADSKEVAAGDDNADDTPDTMLTMPPSSMSRSSVDADGGEKMGSGDIEEAGLGLTESDAAAALAAASAGGGDWEEASEAGAVTRLPEDLIVQLVEEGVDVKQVRKLIFSTWDYGGQHIFRIVHHLFLTRFAVYVACFNMADLVGDAATEATREKSLTELHSWFNDLWMHAAHAPVIPVGTHKDIVSSPEQIQQVERLFRARFEGTSFWPYLASNNGPDGEGLAFFPVDNTRGGGDPTIRLLRGKIEQLASGEEYVDKPIPFGWLRVLDRLQLLNQGKGFKAPAPAPAGDDGEEARPISYRTSLQHVYEIASECGLPSSKALTLETEVAALLDLFHELGTIVHYNDTKLKDMVILDPQWLIDLISAVIRVYEGNLHELPGDEKARRSMPDKWRLLLDEGKLSRSLVELLWEQLTDSREERDTLLLLLQKFDLLLLWRQTPAGRRKPAPASKEEEQQNQRQDEGTGATGAAVGTPVRLRQHKSGRTDREAIYLVPAMLPTAAEPCPQRSATSYPEFFLVFKQEPTMGGDSEDTMADAAKGFMPEGLFPRLLKKAASWYQFTAAGPLQGGAKPVLFREWAQLSFGPHRFAMESMRAQQMIRIQLLVENPVLVMERIEAMVQEIKTECMAQLQWYVAVREDGPEEVPVEPTPGAAGTAGTAGTAGSAGAAAAAAGAAAAGTATAATPKGLLICLQRIQDTIGKGGQLWVGRGLHQRELTASHFRMWIPPAVEKYYDVFISYRQSSDSKFARMLFDCLSKFVFGKEGRRLKVFLDSERLLDGQSWKEGFIDGVKKSTVLVPIVSKGALEPMAQLDPANGKDWCDNVLLEWKLGLELLQLEQYPLQAIFPVMVASVDEQSGEMKDFFAESASVELSCMVSAATDQELRRVLPEATVTVGASVVDTKKRLLECLGVKAWDPQSTHGKQLADMADDDTGTGVWDIPSGCATQIYTVLKATENAQAPLVQPPSRTPAGASDGSRKPSRTKKGIRASAVSTSMAVLLEGVLMKRSTGVLKRWQKRYFVIGGHYLKYADSEDAAHASPKATVDLHALKSCTIKRSTFMTLRFDDKVVLEMQASTAEEATGWHEVLVQFEQATTGERKASMMQLLEHYAPRKGSLYFERKGSTEHDESDEVSAPPVLSPASAPVPPASPATPASPAAGESVPGSWSTSNVAEWLGRIGGAYAKYSEAFIENGIDGEELLSGDFGHDELGELGVASKMHQKRIMKEVQKLKQ
jgi:GTPase SAR1 family protein